MLELLRHLVWMSLICVSIAYTVFVVVGGAIHSQALSASRVVAVRDVYKPGEHDLSGMVMVPNTCSQLVLHTEDLGANTFELRFTTWREPYVDCVEEDTPRYFRAVLFAPAVGVRFVGSLDGSALDIATLPEKYE